MESHRGRPPHYPQTRSYISHPFPPKSDVDWKNTDSIKTRHFILSYIQNFNCFINNEAQTQGLVCASQELCRGAMSALITSFSPRAIFFGSFYLFTFLTLALAFSLFHDTAFTLCVCVCVLHDTLIRKHTFYRCECGESSQWG